MDGEFLAQLESCRADLIALCRGLVRDRNDLEDAVQESIVQALRSYSRFVPGTHFKNWLLQVATHTVFNLNRKRRAIPTPDAEPDPERRLEVELGLEEAYDGILKDPDRVISALRPQLGQAVEQLPEAERTVFLLRSLCEMKYQHIAQTLGIPLGSVMGYLGRARIKLRKSLSEYAHEV